VVIDTDNITKHWRTTLTGLLNAAIAVTVAVMAIPPGTVRKGVYVLAVCTALLGCLQKDAGTPP
jgi:hypothetical protein